MSTRYQLTLRCRSCRHKYKRIVAVDDDLTVDDYPDPPCPKCAKRALRTNAFEAASPPLPHTGMEGIVATQSAPGIIGNNVQVRAIDTAARVVMEDHKLTDLKDNIRMGETMAPRLPTAQQKAADNFFGPKPGAPGNKRQQARMQAIMRRAIHGGYRAGALDVKSVLPDDRVAMRRVGSEPINR